MNKKYQDHRMNNVLRTKSKLVPSMSSFDLYLEQGSSTGKTKMLIQKPNNHLTVVVSTSTNRKQDSS